MLSREGILALQRGEDVNRQNTFHKEYRGAAYAFPLDEFNRGGRPVEHDDGIDDVDETADQRATHGPAG